MRSRKTTYNSLVAAVYLLYAEDQESFSRAYKEATHDMVGDTIWYYMYVKKRKPKKKIIQNDQKPFDILVKMLWGIKQ